MGVNFSGTTGIQYSTLYDRIPQSVDGNWGILTYGTDNLYPQQMEQLKLASPLVKSSTELLEDFLNGAGWELNNDKVVNRFGETTRDILNKAAEDAANFSGAFSLHVNFNGAGQGLELQHVPFMYVRMHAPKRKDGRITHVAVSDNWEMSDTKPPINPTSYAILNPFTAGVDTIRGGKGQILYFTGVANGKYPMATFDSIVNTAEGDAAIQKYERNNIINGFHGASILHWPAPINTIEEKIEVKNKATELIGVNSPGMMVVTVDAETDKDMVETIGGQDNADLFINTITTIRDRVLQVYKQPPALMGISPQGGVFTQLAYFESYTVYNVITRNKRDVIARAFGKVGELMGFKVGKILENDLGVTPNNGEPNAIEQ